MINEEEEAIITVRPPTAISELLFPFSATFLIADWLTFDFFFVYQRP